MRLNFQKLAQMASNLFGIDNSKLNNAINQASSMTGRVNTKQDAVSRLKQYGIGDDFIAKVQNGLASNPMASRFASMMGVDLKDVQRGLDELQGAGGTGSAPVSDDRIGKLRERLKRVK